MITAYKSYVACPVQPYTLDFLDKKHLKIDQGLDFHNFYVGNRGKNQEKHSKNQEEIRNN